MRLRETFLALATGLVILFLPVKWSAALLGATTVSIIVLLHPVAVFPLLALSIPLGSIREISIGPARVGLTELTVALAAGVWLARKSVLRENWRGFGPFFLPALILYGVMAVSVLQATSLEYSLKELLKWGEVLMVYLIISTAIEEKGIPWIVGGLLLAGFVEGSFGVYQFLTRSGPEHFVVMGKFVRAYGHFMQPNPFGGYMGLVMPLALAAGLGLILDRGISWRLRLSLGSACLAVAGVTGMALIMSWSRGAWLGAMAALAVLAALMDKRVSIGLGLLFLILALLIRPPLEPFLARFRDLSISPGLEDLRTAEITDENYAIIERLAHWDAALRMWGDHFWFGVGIGNYEPVYHAYALPRWPEPLGHAHNYYLNIAAETGFIGLLAYLFFWGWVFVQTLRALRWIAGWKRALMVGAIGSFIHLTVHNFFDNLYVHGMYLHVAAVLGVVSLLIMGQDAVRGKRSG
ncbi:MAG: O-antigen ligase family protein [Anaerolineae bacterium]|nr:O-antigen ligase family protein [Anaerolineae bacterium]MDW8101893.1 O-antigen ligase family protein [Anaerolineae bacterium]